jgi:glycosyltransferase involved in cell wall biosynthesis
MLGSADQRKESFDIRPLLFLAKKLIHQTLKPAIMTHLKATKRMLAIGPTSALNEARVGNGGKDINTALMIEAYADLDFEIFIIDLKGPQLDNDQANSFFEKKITVKKNKLEAISKALYILKHLPRIFKYLLLKSNKPKRKAFLHALLIGRLAALDDACSSSYDVIHSFYSHSIFNDHFNFINQRAGRRLISQIYHSAKENSNYSFFDLAIFPSEFELIRTSKRVDLKRSAVIYHPITAPKTDSTCEIELQRSAKYFLTLAIFDDRKQIDLVIKAARHFKSHNFIIAGLPVRSNYFNYCRDLAAGSHNAHILTGISNDLKWSLLKHPNCIGLVVPSKAESFGIVYAEALCCGKPVIGYPDSVNELTSLLNQNIGICFEGDSGESVLVSDLHRLIDLSENFDAVDVEKKTRDQFSLERFKERVFKLLLNEL